jgi:hypothetical protein
MAHRIFRDSLGRRWEAWTVVPSLVERRLNLTGHSPTGVERRIRHQARSVLGEQWVKGWLVFATRGEKRRLAPYPDEWFDLPDAALEALSRRGTPVTPLRADLG